MAEIKQIPSSTQLTIQGNSITIHTFYDESDIPHIIDGDILETTNADGEQGDLVAVLKDYPNFSNAEIDSNGNFIIFIPQIESTQYYINSNGELIWDPNL